MANRKERKERLKSNEELKRRYSDFEEVGMINESRKVLLLRLPPSVNRLWESVTDTDAILGKIRIYNAKENEQPKVTLHLNPDLAKSSSKKIVNKDYKLKNSFNKRSQIRVFSEGSGGIEFQGQVESICTLQPELNKSYIESSGERISYEKSTRAMVKPMTFEDERSQRDKTFRRNYVFGISKQVEEDKETAKMGAWSEGQLREALFKLFAEKEFLSFKEIKLRLNQPDKSVREVLKNISTYHKSGPNANAYELLASYKSFKKV